MRVFAGIATASLLAACGSVPTLRFADGVDDAGSVETLDATTPGDDPTDATVAPDTGSTTSPPPTDDDATSPADSSIGTLADSAPPPSTDATAPPPPDAAATDPCPSHPPAGTTCCGTIECRPGPFDYCNCGDCAKCTAGQVCCMSGTDQFQQCAATVAACPAL
jgi:hypothetical protein